MPIVNCGGVALTFFLSVLGNRSIVVRCFQSEKIDRRIRYEAISRFLKASPLSGNNESIFCNVEYLDPGIQVNGTWYPVVKMPLLKGETLNKYIETRVNHFSFTNLADSLANEFKRIVELLESAGIAHGDLQHGNILVDSSRMRLIGYDGLYLPELRTRGATEKGQPNYQHPGRQNQYDEHLDRFSTIVIYTALRALTAQPRLWGSYSNGDNLLFKADDFRNPEASALFRELQTISELQILATSLQYLCRSSYESIPCLSDFLRGDTISVQLPRAADVVWTSADEPVLDGQNRDVLLHHVGNLVRVVGQIITIRQAFTRNGQPYAFLNFGDWRSGCLYLILWSEALALYREQRGDIANLKGKWVSVTGVLASYTNYVSREAHERPQIVIDVPSAIVVLEGPHIAKRLLRLHLDGDAEGTISTTYVANELDNSTASFVLSEREKVLNALYSGPTTAPKVTPAHSSAGRSTPQLKIPVSHTSQLPTNSQAKEIIDVTITCGGRPLSFRPITCDLGTVSHGSDVGIGLEIQNNGARSVRAQLACFLPYIYMSDPRPMAVAPYTTHKSTITLKSALVSEQRMISMNALAVPKNAFRMIESPFYVMVDDKWIFTVHFIATIIKPAPTPIELSYDHRAGPTDSTIGSPASASPSATINGMAGVPYSPNNQESTQRTPITAPRQANSSRIEPKRRFIDVLREFFGNH